ncbi:MAG TPA: 50S ribosomal protein L25 [Dehalococcoidia bacterium]|nr:50S ribosomal protein L25 [Dehalococcoidia bacterium]
MDVLKIKASKREILGKKTRFLRRQGLTPVHLFGHGLDSLALQCDTPNLQRTIARAGMTRLITLAIEGDKQPRSVFIREIQREPRSGELLHVDFYQVKKTDKIRFDVPIILVGEAPAMKEKGRVLTHSLTSLSLECLPDKLPPNIEVDLSPLEEMDQAIFVRDLSLSPDITVITDPDQMVVRVSEARIEVEEVVEEEVAEEELVGEEAEGEEGEAEAPAEEKPGEKPAD